MSRRGNCHDNTVAESFFQLLKRERIKKRIYATRTEARSDIFEYIEMFYNSKRRHGSNGQRSPLDYEKANQNGPVIVAGFADPLGKFAYNQQLSSQRANTVAKLLVNEGIDVNRIQIQANSQTDLYQQCAGHKANNQLVNCLAPNRRVNIIW